MRYRIVVGIDGSPHGDAALRWSLDAAQVHSGEVVAVFAWQMPFVSIPGAFDRAELEKTAKKFIVDSVSRIVPTPAIPLWTVVAEGDTAASLVEASKEASLLVLGASGRTRRPGRLIGSVIRRCLATATCPVMLITESGEVTEYPPVKDR
jgi:nucleotide-binding universal stress UspA family protein